MDGTARQVRRACPSRMSANHTASVVPRPLALVTGASGGLGADLARELARDGHDLVLVARREAPMQTLAAELLATHGARSTVIAANLGVFDAASRLAAELEHRGLATPDVLVNNAGFGDFAPFARAEPTRLAEMLQLNVVTLTELTRVFLPAMVARRRGRVLLVGAVAGFAPGPGAAVYHATKAYVLSLGEALAYELRGSGVTVTTLCPGPTRTGFAAAAGRENSAPDRDGDGAMDSANVARQGYRALQAGEPVLVPGVRNALNAALGRFAPRSLVLATLADLLSDGRGAPPDLKPW